MGDVVLLSTVKKKKDVEDNVITPQDPVYDFSNIMDRNIKNSERIRKERQANNKFTLRSYRIKN